MGLIAVMSMAGSTVMVIYYLVRGIFRDRWSVQGREWMLKLAIFFFLCPVQKIKYHFPEYVVKAFPGMYQFKTADFYGGSTYTILPTGAGKYFMIQKWRVVLICAGFIASLVFVIYQVNRYYRLRKALSKCSADMTEAVSQRLADRFKLRTFYKKRMRILRSPAVKTPFVIGILRPMICLPESDATQDELEIICCHELVHIKKEDVLVKCICLLVILLHWFNPFSYLLLIEFGRVSEFRCDREVLRQIEAGDRSTYAKLIISSAICAEKRNRLWTTGFGGGKNDIFNRVESIMNMKEKKRMRNFTAIIMLAILCGSATTYAYEMDPYFSGNMKDGEEYGTTDWIITSFDENSIDRLDYIDREKWLGEGIESKLDFSHHDCTFVSDDTGEILYFTEDKSTVYQACTHTYISGEIYKHILNKDGGCTLLIYKGKRCKKCNYTVLGSLIKTCIYPTCPHK